MISDSLIEPSAPVWMVNNDVYLMMISDSINLIESSAPVWMINNEIHISYIIHISMSDLLSESGN